MSRTLYILYNADGSVLGKLRYGYKKLSSNKTCDGPVCSVSDPSDSHHFVLTAKACDITHGGLSLSETPEWVEAKKSIEQNDFKVVQLHRDELTDKLKEYVKTTQLRYPAVLLDSGDGSLSTTMSNTELNECAGKPSALLEALKEKGVISDSKPSL